MLLPVLILPLCVGEAKETLWECCVANSGGSLGTVGTGEEHRLVRS